MDEWLARLIMVIEGVGLVCITGLTAYWMKLRHDRKMRGHEGELAELRGDVEELRTATQAELLALNERLDFADRLLAQSQTPLIAEPDTPTPV